MGHGLQVKSKYSETDCTTRNGVHMRNDSLRARSLSSEGKWQPCAAPASLSRDPDLDCRLEPHRPFRLPPADVE